MKLILSYIKNSFQENFDIMIISNQISNVKRKPDGSKTQITFLRNNIALKSVNEENIWKFTGEQFLLLILVAKHVFCYFGSTYLSKSALSTMNII